MTLFSPQFKVSVTHATVTTDYVNQDFTSIEVKKRECNYDVATLTVQNFYSNFYTAKTDVYDAVKIYLKDAASSTWIQIFNGSIRQLLPSVSREGYVMKILCKGNGAVLEETHCNRDYGKESSNPTLYTPQTIVQDVVTNFVNKSLGSADNTEHAVTNTYVADVATGSSINYINNPYRTNLEVIDQVCHVTSAIGGGSTGGGHWVVDNSDNLLFDTIGAHVNTTEWPDWLSTDEAGSTLQEGRDFLELNILDKAEEYANKVIFITDFRRPSYDYWTENNAALWGNYNSVTITDEATIKVVGTRSLKIATASNGSGEAYWPSTADAAWDVKKWGSMKTIPTLNFYLYHGSDTSPTSTMVKMSTDRATDYFYTVINSWDDPNNTWVHHSIPIGPYWASASESKTYKWTINEDGSPVWTNINSVGFYLIGDGIPPVATELYVDDLHFTGKIIRSAKNSDDITAYKETQKVIIGRDAVDDSTVAADDSGMAARIAYAELLRRKLLPLTVSFTVSSKPSVMAGQKIHVHALTKRDGTYSINLTMRIVEATHRVNSNEGAVTVITASSDLLNSFPIGVPDQYSIMIENLLVNSKEAKDMRATNEVDLLIPILEKDYA